MIHKSIIMAAFLLSGCINMPDNIFPVTGFDVSRYMGKWYEIARLDHSFERGLEKVTAHYSLRNDGGIKVVNRGFDPKKNKWKEVVGKAYFVDESDIGRLKVSFFGPFYGSYNIIDLDKNNYSYSMVCGSDTSYLWILARTPGIKDSLYSELLVKARNLGFRTDNLIFVKH